MSEQELELEYFDLEMVSELKDLTGTDRENIMQQLHIALADNEPKVVIRLNYFRGGKNLCVFSAEFMDLYNVFKN